MNNPTQAKFSILLSTYNGEKYLTEQLNSLYAQNHQNMDIVVRDDSSVDDTRQILQKEATGGRLTVIEPGQNIGPAASFFKLLSVSKDADYYAFCDQDDIWEATKLERAAHMLNDVPEDVPAMYFSRLKFVDSSNQCIKLSSVPLKKIGFGNALVENIATGCTVVINHSARKLLLKHLPEKCVMHDAWIYLVISCFGVVLYDDHPSIRYRQHANNAIGTATNVMDTLMRRIKRFRFKKAALFRYSDQAEMLLRFFEQDISGNNKKILKDITAGHHSLLCRLKLISSTSIWRQNNIDNFILRVLILFNRY